MRIFQNAIPIIPSLLWFSLVVLILIIFREALIELALAVTWRVKSGAGIKIASFELAAAAYVPPDPSVPAHAQLIDVQKDTDPQRHQERGRYYKPNRDLFIVHKIIPSSKPGQLYDILIYLVPHKDATLANVKKVDYYFGSYWGDRIFISARRETGFSVSTSAFGPFVCTAELHFTDGQTAMIWRYIAFEMGQFANAATQG
jgi:hypothetical protein